LCHAPSDLRECGKSPHCHFRQTQGNWKVQAEADKILAAVRVNEGLVENMRDSIPVIVVKVD